MNVAIINKNKKYAEPSPVFFERWGGLIEEEASVDGAGAVVAFESFSVYKDVEGSGDGAYIPGYVEKVFLPVYYDHVP